MMSKVFIDKIYRKNVAMKPFSLFFVGVVRILPTWRFICLALKPPAKNEASHNDERRTTQTHDARIYIFAICNETLNSIHIEKDNHNPQNYYIFVVETTEIMIERIMESNLTKQRCATCPFLQLIVVFIIIPYAQSFASAFSGNQLNICSISGECNSFSYSSCKVSRSATSFFPDEDESTEDYDDYDDDEEGKYAIDDSQLMAKDLNENRGSSSLDDNTKFQIEQQQKQIDMLMEMFKNQQRNAMIVNPQPSQNIKTLQQKTYAPGTQVNKDDILPPYSSKLMENMIGEDEISDYRGGLEEEKQLGGFAPINPSNTPMLAPLKAMFFIDGTWLYYSLHRRNEDRDPIVKKFGKGWQYRYKFDWGALPGIVCEELVKQQNSSGWSSSGAQSLGAGKFSRGVEIVRANVFTSYKKTTDPNGIRVRMFKEMSDANYDIHMLESSSSGPEKCVDISLAVEMLHYATVPNAYDVAILLSGDKDFIPAMVRTRQKGKKVGVVSMRTGCNRALYEKPHVKDYDVVWIDDFLDKLLIPLPADQVGEHVKTVYDRGLLSAFTITKVILDFITRSPFEKVSSRDIGRYLKSIEIAGGTNLLDDVKLGQGGLRRFLQERMPTVFEVIDKMPHEIILTDPNDKSYWIAKRDGANQVLLEEAKRSDFTLEEKEFLKNYQSGAIEQGAEDDIYYYTMETNQFGTSDNPEILDLVNNIPHDENSTPTPTDYSSFTVAQLKELCRERDLLVSGVKAALIQRLEEYDLSKLVRQEHEEKKNPTNSLEQYLVNIIKYYIVECGGYASSRDLGRFLSSNRGSHQMSNLSALQQLKDSFGGLSSFINQRQNIFTTFRENQDNGDPRNFSFGIGLKDDVDLTSIKRSKPSISTIASPFSNISHQKNAIVDPDISNHLKDLVKEYLHASGGEASSRNIGRYLAANSAFGSGNNHDKKRFTALKQLKQHYGSLLSFLSASEDSFKIIRENFKEGQFGDNEDPPSDLSFGVRMIK